jgi:hypothetical protein
MYTQSYFVTRSPTIVAVKNTKIISLFIVVGINVDVNNTQEFIVNVKATMGPFCTVVKL